MAQNAPGKHFRKGITLVEAVKQFGDDASAEAWFVERRWPNGVNCVECDSDRIHTRKPNARRKTSVFHCNDCKKDFTVNTGTIMHDSRLSLGKWALAFFLFSTNLKGVSSMKLHRDLGITQKSAWYLAHRIRETWEDATEKFGGPVEADETYVGGKEANKHESEKLHAGRGTVGKTAVVGVKDRETNRVQTAVVESTDKRTLQEFVGDRTEEGTAIYTDDHRSYRGLPNHEAVQHGVSESMSEGRYTLTGWNRTGRLSSAVSMAFTTMPAPNISTATPPNLKADITTALWIPLTKWLDWLNARLADTSATKT